MSREYWEKVIDEIEMLNLQSDYIYEDEAKYDDINIKINKSDINYYIDSLKLKNRDAIFLALFIVELKKYSSQSVLTIEYSNTVDFFYPFTADLKEKEKLIELILKVDKGLTDLYKNKDDFNKYSYLCTNKMGNILFQSYKKEAIYYPDYKLRISISDIDNLYHIIIRYDSNYFEIKNMQYFLEHYENLLRNIRDIINNEIDSISLLNEKEKKLLDEFNNTKKIFNDKKNVVEMISDNAEKYSDRIAVVYNNEKITYKELNIQSDILANKILNYGIKKNDFVVITGNRGIEMIVGIIAIMKCGAAYVPIDPGYPEERIKYIIDTCEPKLILTYKKNMDNFKHIKTEEIILNETSNDIKNVIPNIQDEDYAYSIFTSGTTGYPKGVILRHKGLKNLVKSYEIIYGLSNEDTLLQFASIAFDQSVWDIFTILTLGRNFMSDAERINK